MHDVFISYSRKNIDFARLLEKRLREYKPPRDVNVAQRYLDVFRDETDFTGADYFQSVERQLSDSTKLVVICSPAARASTYIDDEIRRFAQARGADNIVAVLLDGIPNNEGSASREAELAFPEALCEVLKMPLAIPYSGFDVKKDRIDRGSFEQEWFSLLANVYGVSRAVVERREKRRQARNRRITIGIVGTVITALAAALVVSLTFWGKAVEQRKVAVKALDSERIARLAEEAQRKIADERRQEAERERAAAVREAIAARSQTAGRLSVQAIEKLDGAPDNALALGMAAVDTFHSHGDPLVLPAIGALQRVDLAFAASRQVLPRRDPEAIVIDSSLEWVAVSDDSGRILFGPTGGDDPRLIALPRGILGRDERWAAERPRLLFTKHRLIAAVGIVKKGKTEAERGVIVSWPLTPRGLGEKGIVGGGFPLNDLRTVQFLASPDERWLFWTDGWNHGYLHRVDSAGNAPSMDCSITGECKGKAFSPDSRMFFVHTGGSIHRYTLAEGAPEEQPSLETDAREALDLSTTFHGVRSRENENLPVRLAIFDIRGAVEWWDMSEPSPERHTLEDIFSAYKEDLEVYNVDTGRLRGSLEWRTGGEGILVSIAEKDNEFGIAAFHDLKPGAGWQAIEHRYELKALETTSHTEGMVGGRPTGYSVKNAANLGASSARWITPEGVLTVGFDGTVLFRRAEDQVSDKFKVIATNAACASLVGHWIAVGGRDGKIRFVDTEDDRPTGLELNGHGAPIREVRAALDRDFGVGRMVSSDIAGVTRVWDMTSPIAQLLASDDHYHGDAIVTADWNWLTNDSGRSFWPLGLSDPMWAPTHPAAFASAKAVAWNADASQAATLQIDAERAVVRLWSLGGGKPTQALLAERRFPMPSLGSYNSWSIHLATDEHEARVIIQRTDLQQEGLWITDLLQPREPLRKLGGTDFKLHGASPDLRWLVVSTSAKNPKEQQLAHLPDWTRRPNFIRLEGLIIDAYSNHWSPDGRWLILSGRRTSEVDPNERPLRTHEFVVDLQAAAESGRAGQPAESREGGIYFGRGRLPMVRDEKDTLRVWHSRAGSNPRFEEVTTGPSEAVWDESGQWLAVTRDDRIWLARPGAADGPAELRRQIEAAMRGQPLPQPAEPAAMGKVSSVFPFPELGWTVAETTNNSETENDHILVWHRDADGAWELPLVFTKVELRIDYLSKVRFRPDGRMALFEDQVMSFDPIHLLAYSRRLMAGRVQE